MSDSTAPAAGRRAGQRSTGRLLGLTAAASCQVLVGIPAMIVGTNAMAARSDGLGALLTALLWLLYAVGLFALLARLAGAEAGCSAALCVLLLSALGCWIGSAAWEDLVLRERGRTVRAVVMAERLDTGSRGDRTWYYELTERNGLPVPGPELVSDTDRFTVGRTVTVIEDPTGKLSPRTPDGADPTSDLLGVGGVAAACLAAVGRTAYRAHRGHGRATPRPRARDGAPPRDQEQRLRDALRARNVDRRGYIRLSPRDYPGLTPEHVTRIAHEEGLRVETFWNRGSWRFGERVVQEPEPGPEYRT
ncbi:hypothetical protein ACFYYR_01080 [Streptomyces sp. NPDC001922]|uniref:hypothetical protein n=1 Tax=Streptomyces sp. NPDC001922 TaxID=3364624 RepID=UPI00368A9894